MQLSQEEIENIFGIMDKSLLFIAARKPMSTESGPNDTIIFKDSEGHTIAMIPREICENMLKEKLP